MGFVILGACVGLRAASAQKIPRPKFRMQFRRSPAKKPFWPRTPPDRNLYLPTRRRRQIHLDLKAPEAELKDQKGNVIGSHFAGPSWKLTDGSEVTGKVLAHADSDDSNSIPWLLVKAVGHTGNGLLAGVTTIQRINTHDGNPPAKGCDEAHRGTETKSAYTADYYFYGLDREAKQ